MPEVIPFALSILAVCTPIVIAAFMRDRSIQERMTKTELALESAKLEFQRLLNSFTLESQKALTDSYVRRDDFSQAVNRLEGVIREVRADGITDRAAIRSDLKTVATQINQLIVQVTQLGKPAS